MPNDDFEVPPGQMGPKNDSKMAQKWPKIARKWAMSKVTLDFMYRYGYVAYLLTWHDELNT